MAERFEFSVELVESVSEEDFIELYKDAGWWREEYAVDTSFIDGVVSGSAVFASAFDSAGKMVGMGRAVSDGSSDAYIQDVVVARAFRGLGIGGSLERFLVERLLELGVDWIGLIAEPGSGGFHSSIGFREMTGHIPMKLDLDAFKPENGKED
jgi:spermidine synthase